MKTPAGTCCKLYLEVVIPILTAVKFRSHSLHFSLWLINSEIVSVPPKCYLGTFIRLACSVGMRRMVKVSVLLLEKIQSAVFVQVPLKYVTKRNKKASILKSFMIAFWMNHLLVSLLLLLLLIALYKILSRLWVIRLPPFSSQFEEFKQQNKTPSTQRDLLFLRCRG